MISPSIRDAADYEALPTIVPMRASVRVPKMRPTDDRAHHARKGGNR